VVLFLCVVVVVDGVLSQGIKGGPKRFRYHKSTCQSRFRITMFEVRAFLSVSEH
jgi:hypothetical protein